MNRWIFAGGVFVMAGIATGCGSSVRDLPPAGDGGASSVEGTTGALDETTARDGGGGSGGNAAIDDTGTLEVALQVQSRAEPGTSAEEAQVALWVEVIEWQTGNPVQDAIVTVGPVGSPAVLEYDVYSQSSYFGMATGYQRTWALSVVRGADRLTGVVIVGPSFQSVLVSRTRDAGTILWSPAGEPGVWSEACATYAPRPEPADRCHIGNDEGFAEVMAGGRPYGAMVLRETKVPFGHGGSGTVDVAVWAEAP